MLQIRLNNLSQTPFIKPQSVSIAWLFEIFKVLPFNSSFHILLLFFFIIRLININYVQCVRSDVFSLRMLHTKVGYASRWIGIAHVKFNLSAVKKFPKTFLDSRIFEIPTKR